MSRELLERLQRLHAFDPAPRREDLHDLHVPFDAMTQTSGCESALGAALRRGERVALIGVSGAGKSSVTASVLGPLVEDLVPLPIPLAIERAETASDPVAFARHVVHVVGRWVEDALPSDAGSARQLTAAASTPRERSRRQRFSVAPGWLTARLELAYELQQAVAEVPPSSSQVLDQARQMLELIVADGQAPVLVLDDTDKWLNAAWQTDAEVVRGAFFGRVIRVLAEDFAVAAVVAVHTAYLDDPAYRAADGFLETSIRVPAVPDRAGIGRILARRVALALDLDEDGEGHALNGVIAAAAVDELHQHYASETPDLRRHVLLIAHTALTIACDDAAAELAARHVDLAIAEAAAT